MKIQSFFVLVGFSLVSSTPQSELIKQDLEKFQGTWQLISAETNGKKAPEEQVKKIKVVIKGNKHTVLFEDKAAVKEIPFQIDPTKKPKTVDDTLPNGKMIHGIYEIEGDTLKTCVAQVDEDRPTEFVSKPGTGHTLRIFKRVK